MTTDRALSGAHMARLLGRWRSAAPGYRALADAIRLLVLDGRLPLRTRLPGERDLARALGVSRATATAAYAELRAAGFLASRRGAGSWVRLPADAAEPATASAAAPAGEPIDLATAASPAPVRALHAALVAATAELPRHLPQLGYDAAGLPDLRAAIAAHLTRRGAATAPAQILVTAGAQQALVLVLYALTAPGDRVLVEAPTYPAALDAMRSRGVRPVPAALTPQGWDLEAIATTLRQAAPRLAYLQPEHHNPTGLTLAAADREPLVALARATRTPLVVDETMAELRLEGSPPAPPLAALDPDGETVIATGSMSKAFWAGLRVGWVRASPALVARLARARAALDLASPVIEQLIAREWLRDADPLIASRRLSLRAQRDALLEALAAELPGWRVARPSGGLSVWVELDSPQSTALAALAIHHGVRLAAGPRFGVDGAFERFVRIPYGLPATTLEEAVRRLAAAWRAVRTGTADEPLPGPLGLVA